MSFSLRHVLAALVLSGFLFCELPLVAGEAPEPRARVYLLRMKGAFDLHLANRLTESGLLTVVTDPQLADFVLTEGVGPGFEERFKELYPAAVDVSSSPQERESGEDSEVGKGEAVFARYNPPRATSFGRANGTVFLVRRADSVVVWSTFLERRDTRDAAMHKSAGDIVKRLKKWFAMDAKARTQDEP